ncbi:hypothetical protein Cst_c07390 [Thermoclostridium stercorarium subsp. stercorarium DSM 8532]|uniref:Uncharacterized protein n=1 Tax=Thermoclostridium stercorarium (strain ATCC 35414 / DSM 8532 / NCIMB 11754) TaxID=1121335 RepID=L7VM86_THES1|nr:hypothetical protein Cst_c07390 [Thermoclostridium stercorarium subsp. stercorarium DSM 8532]
MIKSKSRIVECIRRKNIPVKSFNLFFVYQKIQRWHYLLHFIQCGIFCVLGL